MSLKFQRIQNDIDTNAAGAVAVDAALAAGSAGIAKAPKRKPQQQ